MSDCGHSFCSDCLSDYCSDRITNGGGATEIPCPEPGCDASLEVGVVKEVVDEKTFDRFDQAMLNRLLRSMSNTVWCPNLACQHPAQIRGAVYSNSSLNQHFPYSFFSPF